jgi:hypothetical protein
MNNFIEPIKKLLTHDVRWELWGIVCTKFRDVEFQKYGQIFDRTSLFTPLSQIKLQVCWNTEYNSN